MPAPEMSGVKQVVTAAACVFLLAACIHSEVQPAVSAADLGLDTQAETNLHMALTAAKTYYLDGETYTGFDASTAQGIEPSVSFAAGQPAAPNVVSIDLASGSSVVFSTKGSGGHVFCIADDAATGATTYGHVDAAGATSPSVCSAAAW
jgi:hypothetical protein